MIGLRPAAGRAGLAAFYEAGRAVYRQEPWRRYHRATEHDVLRMLVEHDSAFFRHATLDPFLITDGRHVVGRFAVVQDRQTPDLVQVAFFEALSGLVGLRDAILLKVRVLHPSCHKVVVGLNAHLNYGAGFLVEPHDRPPVFGLPYTPPYYLDYFAGLVRRDMVSFHFETKPFFDLAHKSAPGLDLGGIRIRTMDRKQLARETDIYTFLNNASFQRHPYWSDRTTTEDFELLHPFRFLIREENLLFAEENGRPVGFLLWYPDFNELVGPDEPLGPRQVLCYHAGDQAFRRNLPGRTRLRRMNRIRTTRLAEIGVHPASRNRGVVPGLIFRMAAEVEKGGYEACEGGFIFEENLDSMAMTLRYLTRALGRELEASRRFCVFEGELS